MKPLFITLLLALTSYFLAQSPYEIAMNSTLQNWQNAKTEGDYITVANEFDKIATQAPENWEPKYYALLVKTVQSFDLPEDKAFEQIEAIEKEYTQLIKLKDNDETKVLHALFLTVKVAKDPMKYGPTLSESIMSIYNSALKENPDNPRALLHLAEYEMNAAPYFGKNLKDYCPEVQKSINLFDAEKKDGYAPHWGKERAKQILKERCQ